ncbi:MAG: sigma-70 family RNA polymerase sigma factor [Nonomuraea sp.]|nr:sigma-70 family RNA polymerase sigma factor [Nonomuraea sp.]
MTTEELLRTLAPRVLAALVRRYGNFETAEDATQEALLAAATQWEEVPEQPEGWLVRVASRRMVDLLRSEQASRRREERFADGTELHAPPADADRQDDDTLTLLRLCCHPALSPASQIALTLRAVGGLTTAEIAAAFLVPESTMAQRISRAKQRIRGVPFEPGDGQVLHVLYLIFNEGYTHPHRTELAAEAIRLTRMLPPDGEAIGLLALMLLLDARRTARTDEHGDLVPLAEQDRTRWEQDKIEEGAALISRSLAEHAAGPYQIQAAIAAVHDEAERAQDTDWAQIDALYGLLEPTPIVTLNHAVARAMTQGPRAGLAMLETLDMPDYHRYHAVKAHLLEMVGDHEEARAAYLRAARLTTSLPEQRYLLRQAHSSTASNL